MPKDIREILKNGQQELPQLPKNHRKRFEDRLEQLHKPKRKSYFFLKIAASIIAISSIAYFSLKERITTNFENEPIQKISSLSSISPEMQKVERYYLTAINYEIASIEITPNNKVMLDNYLDKIGKLDEDYKRLNNELSKKGITEKIINSLLTN